MTVANGFRTLTVNRAVQAFAYGETEVARKQKWRYGNKYLPGDKVWLGTDTIAEIVKRVSEDRVLVRFKDGVEEEVSVTSIERTSR